MNIKFYGGLLKSDARLYNSFISLLEKIGVSSVKTKIKDIKSDFVKCLLNLMIAISNKTKLIIIDEDEICKGFTEENWALWEIFLHKTKELKIIVLIISEKRTNLLAVDKLVNFSGDQKLDITSNFEQKTKGEIYFVVLSNITKNFDWNDFKNETEQEDQLKEDSKLNKTPERINFEDSIEASSWAHKLVKNGDFKFNVYISSDTLQVYRLEGVNDGVYLLRF